MINEEVSRQAIAIVESGNIKSAKMVIELMKKMLSMVAKKGKSLKEFIEEKKPTTLKGLVKKGKVSCIYDDRKIINVYEKWWKNLSR